MPALARRRPHPTARDRQCNVATTGPILSRDELPVHDHGRLLRCDAPAALSFADNGRHTWQRDANLSRPADFSADRPPDRADRRRPTRCANRKRDVRRRRPALDASGTVIDEPAASVDPAHDATVHCPWQPADDRRGCIAQHDHRQFADVELDQTSVDRRRTWAGIDQQSSLRRSTHNHGNADADIADHNLPVGRWPASGRDPRGDNTSYGHDSGHCERKRPRPPRQRHPPPAPPAIRHDGKHEDDCDEHKRGRAAPAVRPAQRRARNAGKTAGDEDQPRTRHSGRARNPLRSRGRHRRNARRDHAEDRRGGDGGLGQQVRWNGRQADPAGNRGDQWCTRKSRRGRHSQRIGQPPGQATCHPPAKRRSNDEQRRRRYHRQGEACTHRQRRINKDQAQRCGAQRGQGAPTASGGKRKHGDEAHRGGAQHAGLRSGHDHERDDRERADPRLRAQSGPAPAGQHKHSTEDDRHVRTGDRHDVSKTRGAKRISKVR